jgi:protein-tyrosine-phosphatase
MDTIPAEFARKWAGNDRHEARQLDPDLGASSALILTMTRTQRLQVLRLTPSAQPRTYTVREFLRRLNETSAIPGSIDSLIEIANSYRRDVSSDDIDDPFRSSRETHEIVAHQIYEATASLARFIRVET